MGLTVPEVLTRLLAGDDLSLEEAQAAIASVLAGDATPGQIGGLLIALRAKDVTADELTGMVRALLDAAVPLTIDGDAIDTCGTGGSTHRQEAAFHVSTAAALVVAGAGVKVCKHGNRRASATSGSADLLEALGAAVDLGPDGVARCVAEAGIGFCLAPRFHPGMRHPGPVRRELGVRTVFNFLGPLANPARVRRQVVGVADGSMAEKLIGVLKANGSTRAMVVYGHDGLDELTTATTSTIVELFDGEVRSYDVDPAELGLTRVDAAPPGGDTATNVDLARRVLGGEPGPHRDIVLLNAAAALVVAGKVTDIAAGLEAAAQAIDGGQAASALDALVRVSQQAKSEEPAAP
ncbi:MAG TPA: anthranilate phosphoribosyltransferase [Acidimicrobiales bacterium]|nr:anthranilate phosphoribosyltransferase [Acidimicrobiales bacterium]